jgi:hypothetical protein
LAEKSGAGLPISAEYAETEIAMVAAIAVKI